MRNSFTLSLSLYRIADAVDNVADIVVSDHRAGREADAYFEQLFGDAIDKSHHIRPLNYTVLSAIN